jgi:hypothetical protein
MLRKVAVVLSTFIFAFAILSVSVLRCSVFNRKVDAFSATPTPIVQEKDGQNEVKINYVLPYTGKILPDSPFWFVKALRDRIWLTVTTNTMRKAELSLLFADKRLTAAEELFKKDKPLLALSTLTKAEKYLETASRLEAKERKSGVDTKSFLMTLANASLKHLEEIEKILTFAPDDIKPEVIKVASYANNAYKESRDALQSQGAVAPKNPFDGN